MSKRLLCAILFLASLPMAAQQAATPPPAQAPAAAPKRIPIPETFTNLTVLPANISRPDLMAIMRQFSMTNEGALLRLPRRQTTTSPKATSPPTTSR